MRVSIGTAHVLGLKKIKSDALPTTAYLMHGEGCRRNCKFCAQATGSGADSQMLSRIIWPQFQMEEIAGGLKHSGGKNILKRCCIQVVDDGFEEGLIHEIQELVSSGIPLCVSKDIRGLEEVDRLLDLGVERVTIALDAINSEIYQDVKGGSFENRWRFLLQAAQAYPGRIGTHIIIGLGETEEEVITKITELTKKRINVALFAFTPLQGTPLANYPQPAEGIYRRIQIAYFLIKQHGFIGSDFVFSNTCLTGFSQDKKAILRLLTDGKAFETSGCLDCNRPYYNERPGGVIYNYPRPLTPEETYGALKESRLWSGLEIYQGIRDHSSTDLE